MNRPEQGIPADVFYGEEEAIKYSNNSHIINVQKKLTERALDIIAIPEGKPCLVLDIGCGSGISTAVIEEHGHFAVGLDVSESMLKIARLRELDGDCMLSDIGQGFNFKPGMFDACVSISAIQWLCTAEKTSHHPFKRLSTFFTALYRGLVRGARCVFQFYPESAEQLEMITTAAMKSGFAGGLIVDYPNSTKAKKHYLFLMAGYSQEIQSEAEAHIKQKRPLGEDGSSEDEDESEEEEVKEKKKSKHVQISGLRLTTDQFGFKHKKLHGGKDGSVKFKSRDWILHKKESQRKQGRSVRPDSKYSGRKRPLSFT